MRLYSFNKKKPSNKHNYIPWNRNWAVIKRHFPILAKPFVAGIICVLVWRFVVYRFNFSFDRESENSILFIILMFSSFTYAIFAGYAVNTVLSEYKEISKSVVKDDMDTFLMYRDEQLPILMHLLLGTNSLFLIIFTMLFPYHGIPEAIAAVFAVTFLIVLVFVIVTELDDYRNSIWFKEKIPNQWYEVDITKYFKKNK